MAGYVFPSETFYTHEIKYFFGNSLCDGDPEKTNTRRNEKRIQQMKASKETRVDITQKQRLKRFMGKLTVEAQLLNSTDKLLVELLRPNNTWLLPRT